MQAKRLVSLVCLFNLTMVPLFITLNIYSESQADPQKPVQVASAESLTPFVFNGDASYQRYLARQYRLGPNDVIGITVHDAPEFTQKDILIAPDGQITVAPFGTMNLAGMTADELQAELEHKLKKYLNNPIVQIRLEHTKPYYVNIIGEVLHPGPYEMATDTLRNNIVPYTHGGAMVERKAPLLSNVLIAAGGVKDNADLSHIQITNRMEHTQFEVNLLDLLENGDASDDLFLMPGDVVKVPSLPKTEPMGKERYKKVTSSTMYRKAIPVKVLGFVNKPGVVWLPTSQSNNVNSAIAGAGGFLRSAPYPTMRVYVSRTDDTGHLHTQRINPRTADITLKPNDVVYVTDKVVPQVGRVFDYANRLVRPLVVATGAYNLIFQNNISGSGGGRRSNPNGPCPQPIVCDESDPSTWPTHIAPPSQY